MDNTVRPRISNEKMVQYTSAAALATGAASGIAEAMRQNKIFKNADAYIAEAEGAMKVQERFCEPYFKGTQEASDVALKQLRDNFEKLKNFAQAKKFDFKSIGKVGIIGAGIAAGLVALCCFSYNSSKKELQDNAKIVANEFKNAKVGEK